jgi:hypothetical protein
MNIKFLKIAFLRIVYDLFETKKSLILNNESIIAKRQINYVD